jgi:3-methyl-2-oxobutanoate hydroxymethyltransferase
MQGASLVRDAVNQYKNDVQDSSFPSREEEY